MNEESVVVNRQDEIKIFTNAGGGITIASNSDIDSEQVISFCACHADAICLAIQEAKNVILTGGADE